MLTCGHNLAYLMLIFLICIIISNLLHGLSNDALLRNQLEKTGASCLTSYKMAGIRDEQDEILEEEEGIKILNGKIPNNSSFFWLRKDKTALQWDNIFETGNFCNAEIVVIVDKHIKDGNQMHYFAMFLRWILEASHNKRQECVSLKEIVFLTDNLKKHHLTFHEPYTGLTRGLRDSGYATAVYTCIWNDVWEKFAREKGICRNKPKFIPRTEYCLHDRSVTIKAGKKVSRYELSRGFDMFSEVTPRETLEGLGLSAFKTRSSFVFNCGYLGRTERETVELFLEIIKHDSQMNHDRVKNSIYR